MVGKGNLISSRAALLGIVLSMDLDLSQQHRLFRDTVREFAEGEIAPVAEELDRSSRFPLDELRKAAELGLLGIPFPEEYGGTGADTLSYALAIEELGRIDSSFAITVAAHTSLGTSPIYLFGDERQKREWLPPLASGRAARGLRPDRARGRLRRRRHPHPGRASTTASG